MKRLMAFAPVLAMVLMMTGCGGGGTATPDALGENVVGAIQGENFESLVGMLPQWTQDSFEQRKENDLWEKERKLWKWDDHKGRFDGDDSLDPKDKINIDSEDKYFETDVETMVALQMGCYKLYRIDDFEARVTDGKFWLTRRKVTPGEEGTGTAELTYRNKFGDSIGVTAVREDGVWYLADVDLSFEKELPKGD